MPKRGAWLLVTRPRAKFLARRDILNEVFLRANLGDAPLSAECVYTQERVCTQPRVHVACLTYAKNVTVFFFGFSRTEEGGISEILKIQSPKELAGKWFTWFASGIAECYVTNAWQRWFISGCDIGDVRVRNMDRCLDLMSRWQLLETGETSQWCGSALKKPSVWPILTTTTSLGS